MDGIQPKPPPALNFPPSAATVRVQAIDSTTQMSCKAHAFVQPSIPNHEILNLKTMCFMIQHKQQHDSRTDYVLFDCGSRKDYWNSSPQTNAMIGTNLVGMQVEYGVDEILTSSGFSLHQLKSVVWSHWHWDHIGDGSRFPPSVDIVVGPGFTKSFVPGWPQKPNCPVLQSDLEGHRVHEPIFDIEVAGFSACDYFGDGSFYLLDVPGHALGHICGLARTTPDTFVLMGADACHFAGVLRPTTYFPMPQYIPDNELHGGQYSPPCPCSMFLASHPSVSSDAKDDLSGGNAASRTRPIYDIATTPDSVYAFPADAQASVDKIKLLDAHPGVFICMAHDRALFDILPLYNSRPDQDINDWHERQYKEHTRWVFLNELPKGDASDTDIMVRGLRCDGGAVMVWDRDRGFVDATQS